MELKLNKKNQEKIEKAVAKELDRQINKDNKIAKELLKNRDKIKFKIKATTFIGVDGKKSLGACVELFETNTDCKILDGINLDLGADSSLKDLFLGISKDLTISGGEFSIGGYVGVKQAGTEAFKKLFGNTKQRSGKSNIEIRLGISKTF